MAETPDISEPQIDLTLGRPDHEFAPLTFPVVFADGVLSFVPTHRIVKFYLYRIDPNMFGNGGAKFNPIEQVVMPTDSFLQSVMFLQQQVNRMVDKGFITKEQVDSVRASFSRKENSEAGDAG